MMKYYLAVLCSTFLIHGSALAQFDFFWSDKPLNSGAINSDLLVETLEDQGTIFLYYTTNGPTDADLAVGVVMNLSTSKPGVIRFTQTDIFNFSINVAGTPIGPRWPENVAIGDVQDDSVCRWGSVTSFFGEGIRELNSGPVFFDEGYDAKADAFLFGRLDYEVVACGRESVDINISIDDGQIAYTADCIDQPAPSIGRATITKLSTFLLGDVNLDGERDLLDVQPFINLVSNQVFMEEADINKDNEVDLLDVQPFVDLLLGMDPAEPVCKDNSTGEPTGDCLLGDVNQDGVVDLFDDAALVQAVIDGEYSCEADVNEDGIVNVLDVACWVDIIIDF